MREAIVYRLDGDNGGPRRVFAIKFVANLTAWDAICILRRAFARKLSGLAGYHVWVDGAWAYTCKEVV